MKIVPFSCSYTFVTKCAHTVKVIPSAFRCLSKVSIHSAGVVQSSLDSKLVTNRKPLPLPYLSSHFLPKLLNPFHFKTIKKVCMSTPRGNADLEDKEVLVQHLLVKEDQASILVDIQKRLLQGEDLSDLAVEHSICPSKSNGGMIGWISRGRTVPEFEEAAFSAQLNSIKKVKTQFGWHLLQVLAERPAAKLVQVSVEEFAEKLAVLDPEEVQLVDVRETSEIEIASISGFKHYPLSQFGKWAPTITQDFDLEKETFFLCHHGMRSQQAAEWFKGQGFQKLYNIVGGIDAYSQKVDSSIPRY